MSITSAVSEPSATPVEGEVLVFDDLIEPEQHRSILTLVRGPIWAYGWKSVQGRDRFSFWHAQFAGGGKDSRENCLDELARNSIAAPILALWERLSSTVLGGYEPIRVYANAHTYGIEGYVHQDSADNENYFTAIYYAHNAWHPDWAGETAFVDRETGDVTSAVYPRPGRVILFRGSTPHVARSPSRECPELRVSVVFKMQAARAV
ncbi:2OG-Fe(II) oxygenase [Luteimonas sp. SDU101]|uniref:2OG-Fe(II) oxygenase n=1 Tax=unclassified Luteimonas TaxID=2629088 RepID=UPI003EB71A73